MKKLVILLTLSLAVNLAASAASVYAMPEEVVSEEILMETKQQEIAGEEEQDTESSMAEEPNETVDVTVEEMVSEAGSEVTEEETQEVLELFESEGEENGNLTETPETDFEWSGNTIKSYRGTDAQVVVIPRRAEKIDKSAFSKNEKIEKVVIGENVTVIEERAFYYCKNLKNSNLCRG